MIRYTHLNIAYDRVLLKDSTFEAEAGTLTLLKGKLCCIGWDSLRMIVRLKRMILTCQTLNVQGGRISLLSCREMTLSLISVSKRP